LNRHQLYEALKSKADEAEAEGLDKVSIKGVLDYIGLNRANYYNYFGREETEQRRRRKQMTPKIERIYRDSKEIYGAPKVTRELNKELAKTGDKVSQKYVAGIMKENGWMAHYSSPWTRTTKDCDFSDELVNVLKRDFNPTAPNRVWCTDITYIWTSEDEFVYLTSIMDLYSRKIISWTLSRTMVVGEVLKCLEEAKERRNLDKPLVMHADRGSQFTSKKYKDMTQEMIKSYSDKGNPWDNAVIESFHAIIKREWLKRFKIRDYQHAKSLIFEYIEGFYNRRRIHSFCDYLSPDDFEKQYLNKLANSYQEPNLKAA
jgi:transposase InsO family protein